MSHIDDAIANIEKKFGEGAVMRLGDKPAADIAAISTTSISLDQAIGIGGVPRGRVVEIYGPESSGKTTLALHVVAEAQKAGGSAAYIDAEHALDAEYAQNLGVKVDDLLISQPNSGDEALDIAEILIRSNEIDVVVIDSVAALVPKAELNGEMGDSFMGLHARLMSQAMRKLTAVIAQSNTCVIFINQIREKIGVMFGSPETTTGGRALKFYASLRLDIRRIGAIKDGEQFIGNRTKIKVVKNKLAPPFRECEVSIIYGKGISHYDELVDLGIETGIIVKKGSWLQYQGTNLGQGKSNAINNLENNDVLHNEIWEKVKSKFVEEDTLKLKKT